MSDPLYLVGRASTGGVPDLMEGGSDASPIERAPYFVESSEPGVFVVGDVRHGSIKRLASAVVEGALAIALVHRFLERRNAGRT